jgi:hypothetical protein
MLKCLYSVEFGIAVAIALSNHDKTAETQFALNPSKLLKKRTNVKLALALPRLQL